MSNFTRNLERVIKPWAIVLVFLIALCVGFCRESRADVKMEVGAGFLSGEFSKGASLLLTERLDKYSIGVGYIMDQEVTDRGGNFYDVRSNIFLQGFRNVDLSDKWTLGLGMAYFQNTNRALGSEFTFTLRVEYNLTDHWSINAQHNSNAGSVSPNMGQDMLTVGYRF